MRKSVLIASITYLAFSSISIAFAGTTNIKIGQKIHRTNKLNEILPEVKINLEKYKEKEKYKSAYQKINLITFDDTNCKEERRSTIEESKYSLCIRRSEQSMIGKIESPSGNLSALVYWVNGKREIVADTADTNHSIIWFFSEGELIAQLNSNGSEDTLKISFTSKERKEAINLAGAIANNLSKRLPQNTDVQTSRSPSVEQSSPVYLCNGDVMLEAVSAAFMYYDSERNDWIATGWMNIEPRKCIQIFKNYQGRIFIYGSTSSGVYSSSSSIGFCASNHRFYGYQKTTCTGKERFLRGIEIAVPSNGSRFTFGDRF